MKTSRYTKLSKAISTAKTSPTIVASIFLEHWMENYGNPSRLVTITGPQLVSKFFVAVCCALRVNSITTTEYHPETSGPAECFNYIFISRLCHYEPEHRASWHWYLFQLMYTYNLQVHRFPKITRFILALTETLSGPATVIPKHTILATYDDVALPMNTRLELIKHVKELRRESGKNLGLVQRRYKKDDDQCVYLARIFCVGEYVISLDRLLLL